MKKYFRIMLAGVLALVMLLSLASCAKLEMDDVKDALKDYAEDNEDECEFTDIKKTLGKKALVAGFKTCGKLKGDIEACYEFSDIEDDDPTAWCVIVEFEETADAKTVEEKIEKKLEDFFFEMMLKMSADQYGEEYDDDMLELLEEALKEEIDEIMPSKVTVERQGNIVFFGEKKTVKTVLEIIEDAK